MRNTLRRKLWKSYTIDSKLNIARKIIQCESQEMEPEMNKLYNFMHFFHLRFHLLRFTLYLKTKLQFSLVSGFVTIFRHSRLVLKDFVCESVFISALRFLFCSNHKRCRTVYFTKNYTKIEILAIWKVSDLYPKSNFNQGCPVRECLSITDGSFLKDSCAGQWTWIWF